MARFERWRRVVAIEGEMPQNPKNQKTEKRTN
jgi:hypothetical protein